MTVLSCKQLHIRLGTQTICHNLQLDISPGDRWALLGPNGSGKTTLLKTLAGLHQPTQGAVYLDDQPLAALSRKRIATHIGMLFQHSDYPSEQTVEQHCLQGRYPHLKRWQQASNIDEQISVAALKCMELESMSQKPVGRLSGGERRRLAIATLLTQNPRVFLLDEPTNHLDLRHQLQALAHFSSLQYASIIMSLHDIRLVKKFCNKVILLFPHGEIIHGDTGLLSEKNLSRLYDLPTEWLPLLNE